MLLPLSYTVNPCDESCHYLSLYCTIYGDKPFLNFWRYLRDFEVETIGLKETSRRCSVEKCGAKLKDTVLDWEVNFLCCSNMKATKLCL